MGKLALVCQDANVLHWNICGCMNQTQEDVKIFFYVKLATCDNCSSILKLKFARCTSILVWHYSENNFVALFIRGISLWIFSAICIIITISTGSYYSIVKFSTSKNYIMYILVTERI